jgi:3-mercaptopyruvate sulfurtransferase SseA
MKGLRVLFAVAAVALAASFPSARVASQAPDRTASVPRMTMAEFKKRLAAGDVVVVDVRGLESYKAGHIPGAVSVPYDKVQEKAQELKTYKKPIVTYCA